MAIFTYQAEVRGKVINGEVKAQSLHLANLKLKSRNIDPIYVTQKPLVPLFAGGSGIKPKEILFFTRQLSFLLSSGISLIQSLSMIIKMTKNLNLASNLRDILKMIEGGKSFSQALKMKPHIFDGFYVNMIVCAEETGLLDQVLGDLANYIEKMESIRGKVRSAMVYPVLVLGISLSIIFGIIIFVVPKFESLYSGAGGDLPALTQVFVNLSHFLRSQWIVFLGAAIIVPLVFIQYIKTESGRRQVNAILKILPVFGKLQYHAALARFCRAFHSLLKSGVNFLEALVIARNISGHEDIIKGLDTAKQFVSQGKSFTRGLEHSKMFPPLVVNMTGVAEESGKLDSAYQKLTVYYEEEVENLVSGLIKMIEPLLMVVLGGMIGLIILALYLPIFNLGEII